MKTISKMQGLFAYDDRSQTAGVLKKAQSLEKVKMSKENRASILSGKSKGSQCVVIPPDFEVSVHYPEDLMVFYGTVGAPYPSKVFMSHEYCFFNPAQLIRTATAVGYPDQVYPLTTCPSFENTIFYTSLIPQYQVVRYGVLVLGLEGIVALREWDFYGKNPGPDCLSVVQNIENYHAALIFEGGEL